MLKKIRRENRKQFLMSMLSVIIAAFLFETFVSCRRHALDLDKNSAFKKKKKMRDICNSFSMLAIKQNCH